VKVVPVALNGSARLETTPKTLFSGWPFSRARSSARSSSANFSGRVRLQMLAERVPGNIFTPDPARWVLLTRLASSLSPLLLGQA
jgi:hypothetical protein